MNEKYSERPEKDPTVGRLRAASREAAEDDPHPFAPVLDEDEIENAIERIVEQVDSFDDPVAATDDPLWDAVVDALAETLRTELADARTPRGEGHARGGRPAVDHRRTAIYKTELQTGGSSSPTPRSRRSASNRGRHSRSRSSPSRTVASAESDRRSSHRREAVVGYPLTLQTG